MPASRLCLSFCFSEAFSFGFGFGFGLALAFGLGFGLAVVVVEVLLLALGLVAVLVVFGVVVLAALTGFDTVVLRTVVLVVVTMVRAANKPNAGIALLRPLMATLL